MFSLLYRRSPQRLQIRILQRHQSELGVDLGRTLQVRFRPVETAHLRFVAGKIKLDRSVLWMLSDPRG
jgi:hypothetical protein